MQHSMFVVKQGGARGLLGCIDGAQIHAPFHVKPFPARGRDPLAPRPAVFFEDSSSQNSKFPAKHVNRQPACP
jgi:hypothetical protein